MVKLSTTLQKSLNSSPSHVELQGTLFLEWVKVHITWD